MNTPDPSVSTAARMLAVGEFWPGSTGFGLAAGFRDHGWDVAEAELADHMIKGRGLTMRIAARLLAGASARSYNQAVVDAAEHLDAELMITVKGTYLALETLRALGKHKVFRTNFYPDYHFDYKGFDSATLDAYDLVATTKSFQLEYLRQRIGADRVALVHHGYVPEVHRPRGRIAREEDYRWDISFVGNASASKLSWLNAVARAFPNRSMIIVGNGWRELARGTPLESAVLGYGLIGNFFARIIELSRINIAVHHGASNPSGWQDLVSTRTFEIPACGGFMLHIDNEEVRTLFDVPSEIDTFADPGQLCDQIAYYLERPALRADMIARAYTRCVPAYSLTTRASEIAREIEKRR
jgi:hypothetical protein